MAAVAAAAGLSEGTLYNYFHNKTDLVIRVSSAISSCASRRPSAPSRRRRRCARGSETDSLHLSSIIEDEENYRTWLREVRGVKSYRRSAGRDALARFANQFPRLLDRFGHTRTSLARLRAP